MYGLCADCKGWCHGFGSFFTDGLFNGKHNYWCTLDRHCLGKLLMDCHVAALFMVFDTILRCFLLSGACHEMRLVNMFI